MESDQQSSVAFWIREGKQDYRLLFEHIRDPGRVRSEEEHQRWSFLLDTLEMYAITLFETLPSVVPRR